MHALDNGNNSLKCFTFTIFYYFRYSICHSNFIFVSTTLHEFTVLQPKYYSESHRWLCYIYLLNSKFKIHVTLHIINLKLMLIFMQIPGNTEKLCQTYAIITYFMSGVRKKILDGRPNPTSRLLRLCVVLMINPTNQALRCYIISCSL